MIGGGWRGWGGERTWRNWKCFVGASINKLPSDRIMNVTVTLLWPLFWLLAHYSCYWMLIGPFKKRCHLGVSHGGRWGGEVGWRRWRREVRRREQRKHLIDEWSADFMLINWSIQVVGIEGGREEGEGGRNRKKEAKLGRRSIERRFGNGATKQ